MKTSFFSQQTLKFRMFAGFLFSAILIILIGGVGILSIQAVVSGAGDILMSNSDAQAVYDIASKWRLIIIVMSIAAVGLAMVEGFLLLQSIVNPIEKIAETLTSGAEHVAGVSATLASSSQIMANDSSRQADSVAETNEALQQIQASAEEMDEEAGNFKSAVAKLVILVKQGIQNDKPVPIMARGVRRRDRSFRNGALPRRKIVSLPPSSFKRG